MASRDLPNNADGEEASILHFASEVSCHVRKNYERSLEQNDQAETRLNFHKRGIKSGRASAAKTTDDVPVDQPLVLPEELANTLSAEDIQAAAVLWQKNPELSAQFSTVIDFLQLWCVQPQCYDLFHELLYEIQRNVQDLSSLVKGGKVAQFAGMLGFAEKTCTLYQQALRQEGIRFFNGTEDDSEQRGDIMRCLYDVRCVHLRFTHRSPSFSLLLAKSGMLSFLVEDLKHMYHNNHDDLAEASVFLQSVGCLHNCCRNPDILRVFGDMELVHHLSPYLSSGNTKVKMMMLMTLAHVVEEHQNDLLVAHNDVLDFFLRQIGLAWNSERHHHDFCCVEELLHALRHLSKLDSNKAVLLEKGVVQILTPVLRDGSDAEKLGAVGVLWELGFNDHNSRVIQSSPTLGSLLEGLKNCEHSAVSDRASKALWTMEGKSGERQYDKTADGLSEETVRHPDLEELLQPMQNAMQILAVGPLEMAVTQLNLLERQGQGQKRAPAFCTRAQLLRGVLQLIRNDEKKAREFVEKGGVSCLTQMMTSRNTDEEETGCAKAVLRKLIACRLVSIDEQVFSRLSEGAWSGKGIGVKGVETEVREKSVYISCHPQDQSLACQVRDHLQQHHYDVRVSADTSGHAAPQVHDIARAVRSCSVVQLCVSRRYKASAHCRMEAEYADELQKDLIALVVEADYQPSGWLANLLLKVKAVVDVTDTQNLDRNLNLLGNMLHSAGGH